MLKDIRAQGDRVALDRRAIIDASGPCGGGDRARRTVALGYNGDVRATTTTSRAKQLLDEAGLRDPDGDGPAPRLRLVYKTSADAFRVAIARVIAAQLAEVGIAVEIRSFEFATFFADIKKGAYQLASMQTAEITEPDFYFMYPVAIPTPGPRREQPLALPQRRRRPLDLRRPPRARPNRPQAHLRAGPAPGGRGRADALWHGDNVVLSNVAIDGYRTS
jgi:peptide/nickel transport system substrate-binding protein